jgi:hypothetical protein
MSVMANSDCNVLAGHYTLVLAPHRRKRQTKRYANRFAAGIGLRAKCGFGYTSPVWVGDRRSLFAWRKLRLGESFMNPCVLSSDSHAMNHLYGCFRMLKMPWQCVVCIVIVGTVAVSQADPSSPCTPPDSYALNVQYFCQQGDALCWAASAQMIMNDLGHIVEQCLQVDDENKNINVTTDCCHNFQEAVCDFGDWPHFEDFGFTVKSNQVAMSWDDLRDQIYCKQEPFAWAWCYVPCNPSDLINNNGHMFVVYGYYIDENGVKWIEVYNPDPTCSNAAGTAATPNSLSFPYEEYVNGQPDASGNLQNIHWLDYYDLTWTGAQIIVRLPQEEPTTNVISRIHHWPPPVGPDVYHQSRAVAARSVMTFSMLATEKNLRNYGFEKPEQVADARPGIPFAMYYVRPDDLRAYHRGVDPNNLLRDSGRIMYPIAVDGRVLSSVTLRKRGVNWEPSSLGSAVFIRLMSAARHRSAERPLIPLGSYFVVQLPIGANSYMVGHHESAALVLTPIVNDQQAGFRANEDTRAETIFAVLASVAQRAKGPQ